MNKIDSLTINLGFHFARAIVCKLGEGSLIPFSFANWCGVNSITSLFPDIYAISKKKERLWTKWVIGIVVFGNGTTLEFPCSFRLL